MKLSLGADHGGLQLKTSIIAFLKKEGHEVIDHGTHTEDSVDYPDFASLVATDIKEGEAEFGILCCTSGVGMSMAANKHEHIRALLAFNEEIAKLSRLHNNANVICFGQKYISLDRATACIQNFITTQFEGGRHLKRTQKLNHIFNHGTPT